MQEYLLRNLSELAQKRAVLMREEAQLWDILSRDLTREARRLEETVARKPRTIPPLPDQTPKPVAAGEKKLMVGIAEAARMMGVGRSTLYNEISTSRLKVRKAGKRTLIAVSDIEDWCRDLPVRPT
jgi:excisionase family DNA binding protein